MEYKVCPHKLGTPEEIQWRKDNGQYPYWANEFYPLMKGYEVWYNEVHGHKEQYDDVADGYRVFCILCNNNSDKTRMEVLDMLKNATREKPIDYQGELIWCEKL